jgi:hypothetical protein
VMSRGLFTSPRSSHALQMRPNEFGDECDDRPVVLVHESGAPYLISSRRARRGVGDTDTSPAASRCPVRSRGSIGGCP